MRYTISAIPGYFTGSEYGLALIKDEVKDTQKDELVWYFNDMYKLFLYHYANLGHENECTEKDEARMLAMLSELCKVKRMLNEESL